MENRNDKNLRNQEIDAENQGQWMQNERSNEMLNFAPDRDDSKDDEEEETESADWGDVDPQNDPLIPPGPMDPSGPGSAV